MDEVKKILDEYKLKPTKRLGQNFLMNEQVIDKITEAGELKKNDVVLEIGPGLGILTKELVKRVKKVVSVELDKKIFALARRSVSKYSNITLINENILNISNQELLDRLYDSKNVTGSYKVIANIPYNITSPILQKFTEREPKPELMVLLMQKEVAKRVTAPAGDLSVLGVAVQFYCDAKIVDFVPAKDFFPSPEVDSAIVKFVRSDTYPNLLKKQDMVVKDFFKVVKIGFSAKRKKLYNNLIAGLRVSSDYIKKTLISSEISVDARAQELTLAQWINLAKKLKKENII